MSFWKQKQPFSLYEEPCDCSSSVLTLGRQITVLCFTLVVFKNNTIRAVFKNRTLFQESDKMGDYFKLPFQTQLFFAA